MDVDSPVFERHARDATAARGRQWCPFQSSMAASPARNCDCAAVVRNSCPLSSCSATSRLSTIVRSTRKRGSTLARFPSLHERTHAFPPYEPSRRQRARDRLSRRVLRTEGARATSGGEERQNLVGDSEARSIRRQVVWTGWFESASRTHVVFLDSSP